LSASSIVEIRRGPLVESSHRVSIVVVDGAGHVRATSGDPDLVVFARSAVKPVQAQPLVDDGVLERFGWGDPELALACASHSGEAQHVDLAGTMLESIGVGENALACGAHMPFDDAAARLLRDRGMLPRRLHNNCSGKHAGMLALAAAHGWRLDGYNDPAHPVQRRMLEEMARWSGVAANDIGVAVDGCGVATFALPLRAWRPRSVRSPAALVPPPVQRPGWWAP
jgi:L-asparaginase II